MRASLAVSEDVDVLSGGAVTVSSASARLESSGAVSVASGSQVSVSGASASLEVSAVPGFNGRVFVERSRHGGQSAL